MAWDDQDDLDFIMGESADEKKNRIEHLQTGGADRMRSQADDILDAVADVDTSRKDLSKCPRCGGATKVRGAGVGHGVRRRKCRNAKCGHTYPVGMVARPGAVRQQPVVVPGVGPYLGEGGPPMDRNQPVQRRIAEHIRRIKERNE